MVLSRRTYATGFLVAFCAAACVETLADERAPSAFRNGPESASATAACAAADERGHAALHRLNRAEYDNTVRDLIAEDLHPSQELPPDDGANGFRNNADVLSVSPLHFEAFDAAAQKIATRIISGPARARIVTCDAASLGDDACARQVLGAFAKRAWRRPVEPIEIDELVGLVGVARAEGESFDRGIELALHEIFVSPNFWFRMESDPDPSSVVPHPVDDYALASRLSYFLWSSMPDDELFAAAEAKKLGDVAELERQARRMLESPKSAALLENFAESWFIAPFESAAPTKSMFPAFDDDLKHAMHEETSHALREHVLGTKSFLDLLDSDTTWVNERLAKHYGIAGITGPELRPVSLVGTGRRGLLGQASVLTMTSTATRSSPTRRGNWVLTNVLCDAPPPPPANVPPLSEPGAAQTLREALEQHRNNPVCAGCHVKMDPLGLTLEHFDGIGAWRDQDRGRAIDTKTTLEDGRIVDGETELASALKSDPRVPTCATSKLLSFALGRASEGGDTCRVKALAESFKASGYRMKELIVSLIKDDTFRMRHGGK